MQSLTLPVSNPLNTNNENPIVIDKHRSSFYIDFVSGKFDLQLHQVWHLIVSISELRMSVGTFLTGENNQLVNISECRNQVSIRA